MVTSTCKLSLILEKNGFVLCLRVKGPLHAIDSVVLYCIVGRGIGAVTNVTSIDEDVHKLLVGDSGGE